MNKKIEALGLLYLFVLGGFFGAINLVSENVHGFIWIKQIVDTGSGNDVGKSPSIAIDAEGNPHVSYYDDTGGNLKYAKWSGTSWTNETVYSSVCDWISTSIALDNNGYPHIGFTRCGGADAIKYAKWNGSGWEVENVHLANGVGGSISMALDNNGYPHICYYKYEFFMGDNGDLRYAKWNGLSWDLQIAASQYDVGWDCSLALNDTGYARISHYDATEDNLKYTEWNGSAWNTQTRDMGGDVGHYTSIALDSNGFPHISYYDKTNGNLKYARRTETSWNLQIIDSKGDVGKYTSIAIDGDDNPHISYYDSNGGLKYAKRTESERIIQTVDSGISIGMYSSIALDSDGHPHIVYYDGNNGDLKYAKGIHTPPDKPKNLIATPSNSEITISWEAPDSDGGSSITGYKIYRGNTSDGEKYLTTVGNILTYTDTSLTNGQTYWYKVSAVNSIGEGPLSNEASASPATVPSATQNLEADAGTKFVNLSWSVPLDDGGSAIIGYNIYRNSTAEVYAFVSANQLWYNDTNVVNGVNYTYHVSAINIIGIGANSSINETPMTVPSAPHNLHALTSDAQITLTWIAPRSNGGSAIMNYKIYRGTTSGNETLLDIVGNVLTYIDTNVINGQIYYYKVSAVNGVGEGAKSNETFATPTREFISSPDKEKSVLEELWLWLLIGIVLAILIAVILLLALKRKKELKPNYPQPPPKTPKSPLPPPPR
ncbi:MAG: fibronectin type III domain-containing protein [Thermoplasmata archaeon]|nr:MAG: fibronectin type III domain-containing protein [Thermoplasmata archaeon]